MPITTKNLWYLCVDHTLPPRTFTFQNVLGYLLACMERCNTELLVVLVTFLKKLTVHEDCKLAIATPAVVLRLNQLLRSRDDALVLGVLKLIYNLSFDAVVRSEMVKLGMIPRVCQCMQSHHTVTLGWQMVDMLAQDQWAELVLGVLYHTSNEPQHRAAFAASGCVPKLFDMLVRARKLADVQQLVALVLNLSNHAGTIQARMSTISSTCHCLMLGRLCAGGVQSAPPAQRHQPLYRQP